jgi:hypothetical protein
MMKKLQVKVSAENIKTFEAERIIKTDNSIIAYIGQNTVFEARGISDFKQYEILNGDWDEPDDLKETLGTLLLESANDKATIAGLEETVGTLMLEIATMKGGNA